MSLERKPFILFSLFKFTIPKRELLWHASPLKIVLDHVDNRFELVLVASKRARQLARQGMEPTVEWDNDKPTVVALREIAVGHVTKEILKQREQDYQTSSLDLALSTNSLNLEGFSF